MKIKINRGHYNNVQFILSRLVIELDIQWNNKTFDFIRIVIGVHGERIYIAFYLLGVGIFLLINGKSN